MSERCPGTGQRTLRGRISDPDRCPVCKRIAYVCVDGTTGSHRPVKHRYVNGGKLPSAQSPQVDPRDGLQNPNAL